MRKGSKLYSILKNRCPRCQEGAFWEYSNPYHPLKFSKMNETCSCCGLKYERETGFFYGAMYVSYGLGAMIFVAVWVAILILFPNTGMIGIAASVVVAMLVMFPIMFRTARLIWINIFTKFSGEGCNQLEEKKA